MRQPRLTFPGAFHHCMNRGINGEEIFSGDDHKRAFVDLLAEKTGKYRIRLIAYCIMDNHYHLVLQNASGRMSDFFRNLNTHYAFYYRKTMGGKGYVFQNRFYSTIIADGDHLKMAIVYVLQNPLRAGLAIHYRNYRWSSARLLVEEKQQDWLDAGYVLELFGGRGGLDGAVQADLHGKLPLLRTPFGPVLGDKSFLEQALEKFERRHQPDAVRKRRRDDFCFEPVEKVVWEFERKNKVKVDDLPISHHAGKRLRAELLVRLRDLSGLTYRQISEFPIFSDLHYKSLITIYKNGKNRLLKQ